MGVLTSQPPPYVTFIISTTICHYHHHNHHNLPLSSSQPPPSVTIIIITTTTIICHYHLTIIITTTSHQLSLLTSHSCGQDRVGNTREQYYANNSKTPPGTNMERFAEISSEVLLQQRVEERLPKEPGTEKKNKTSEDRIFINH